MSVLGYKKILDPYGGTRQQAMTLDPADYAAFDFSKPVLGLILSVNPSDNDLNRSAMRTADRRGYLHTCTVMVVEDGRSSMFTLDNVIITPDAPTGLRDYYERLPRGCTGLVTGENWNSQINNINPYDLDGDWCLVGFLGGNLSSPFVLRWWPHPRNPYDAATSGNRNANDAAAQDYLVQDGRYFHRINDVEYVVTKTGNIYVSTHRANSTLSHGSPITPEEGRYPRTLDAETGGSVKVWIKESQSFELDWNPPVNGVGVLDLDEAELPQTNPAQVGSAEEKENTYVLLERDRIHIEVPENIEVISGNTILLNSDGDTTLTVGSDLTLDVSGNWSNTVDGDSELSITGSLDISVTGNTSITTTGQTDITSTAPMTITGRSTLEVTGTASLSLTGASVSLSGSTVTISGTSGGGGGTPGSIGVDPTGVSLGSGTLGGVVGGRPFLEAFAAFQTAMATASALATVEAAYAAAVNTAVIALVTALLASVSTTTRTG